MAAYDFRSLNDKEFESVVVDLLSEEYGHRVERFKPGKDKGVDGRWFSAAGGESIVQCKHWVESGYPALLRHLKGKELAKVSRLSPHQYVLATSVPLSRQNKKDIRAVLSPWVRREDDVLGAEDLNDLLAKHTSVEERHYKLWLASTATLNALLNRAVLGRSRAELEDIRAESALYVPTSDHDRARRHLHENRVVILSGEPGIGKTTLARQLVLEHVAHGYALVVIEDDIKDAESVFDEDSQQIFYFDDFLGRTYLEAIRAKQDSYVVNFMKRVVRHANKRFVLTSRTNILNQGANLSDLFGDSRITKNTYELAIRNLKTLDRARILYNHVWHSRLNPDYIAQLYKQHRYKTVIKHQNFNPRLVAFVLDNERVVGIPSNAYWEYLQETLNHPRDIWESVFSLQLDQNARDLAFLAVLNGGRVGEAELRDAFSSMPTRRTSHPGEVDIAFRKAIRHVANSVLSRHLMPGGGPAVYTLFNPSIEDYVLRYLDGASLWAHYFPCLRTIDSLDQFEQLASESVIDAETARAVLSVIAKVETSRQGDRDAYSLRVARLLANDDALARRHRELVVTLVDNGPVDGADSALLVDYIKLFVSYSPRMDAALALRAASMIGEAVSGISLPTGEEDLIAAALQAMKDVGALEASRELREAVLEHWRYELEGMVRRADVLSSYQGDDDRDDAYATLERYVRGRLSESGVVLRESELTELCESVDLSGVLADNAKASAYEDAQFEEWRESRMFEENEWATVDDLFDRSDRD